MIVAATAVAGGTIPRQNPASIRKSGPEIKNHCAPRVKSQENPAAILKLAPSNQESLHAGGRFRANTCGDSQVYPMKSRITAHGRPFPGKNLQRFPNSPPQIKNHCSTKGVSSKNLQRFPSLPPQIKNQCTQPGINRQNLASILKFGPEIKNRCTKQPIFSTHPQHIPPARVPSRVDDVSCLGVLHGDGLHSGSTAVRQWRQSGC